MNATQMIEQMLKEVMITEAPPVELLNQARKLSFWKASLAGDNTARRQLAQWLEDQELEFLEKEEVPIVKPVAKPPRKQTRAFITRQEATHEWLLSNLVWELAFQESSRLIEPIRAVLAEAHRILKARVLLPPDLDQEGYIASSVRVVEKWGVYERDLARHLVIVHDWDHSEVHHHATEVVTGATSTIWKFLREEIGRIPQPLPSASTCAIVDVDLRSDLTQDLGQFSIDDEGEPLLLPFSKFRGFLHALNVLAEYLAVRFQWCPSSALMFLLCGATPFCRPVRVEHDVREPSGLSRILIRIDPASTPDQVARIYSDARYALVGNRKTCNTHTLAVGSYVYGNRITPHETLEDFGEHLTMWQDFPELVVGSCGGNMPQIRSAWDFQKRANFARETTLHPRLNALAKRVDFPQLPLGRKAKKAAREKL